MCDLCYSSICFPRCPRYIPPKTNHYCSICDEGIQNGEDYIVNDDSDYAHWECFRGTKHLADWLGYTVKEMEENNEQCC